MAAEKSTLSSTILLEVAGPVARLTVNRPPFNILDLSTLTLLLERLTPLRDDLQIQLLVLAGAGEKAFSAGVDVKDHTPEQVPAMLARFHEVILTVRAFPVTTLAVVRGVAYGGGCELALACDLVIAEEGARFGQPEINVGCFPPASALLLPELIGAKRAYEMLLLGHPVPAPEAHRMGLVNLVVPSARLDETVRSWCEQITAKSAAVTRLLKEAMAVPPGLRFAEGLKYAEGIYVEKLMKTEDSREGITAFLEKRKPNWKGR